MARYRIYHRMYKDGKVFDRKFVATNRRGKEFKSEDEAYRWAKRDNASWNRIQTKSGAHYRVVLHSIVKVKPKRKRVQQSKGLGGNFFGSGAIFKSRKKSMFNF